MFGGFLLSILHRNIDINILKFRTHLFCISRLSKSIEVRQTTRFFCHVAELGVSFPGMAIPSVNLVAHEVVVIEVAS